MRIAYIGQKGIPAKIGGVERYVDEVAVRMAKRGHDVSVYVRTYYTPKSIKNYKGVKIIHLPTIQTKHLDAITHTFLASVHAIFQNYDAIHYHSLGPTSLSFIPKLFSKKTAIISTYQTQDYFHAKWGFFAKAYLRFGEWMTHKIPDKIISVTEILRQYGLKNYNRDSIIIPNGVTIFGKAAPLKVFPNWNLKKGEYVFTVARLVEHKEIHTLIQAFINLKALRRIKSDYKLVIAGGGSYTDRYVREIKAQIRGRKDIILAGVQRGEKLTALYKNAAFYAQPSRAEGLSLALLESMGMGLAPLVSDIPENLYAVAEHGKVFQVSDLFDLMNKLEYMISNPEKAKLMGEKASRMVKEKYNWENIVRDIEGVYVEAMEEKNSRTIPMKASHQVLDSRRITGS